MIRISQVKTTNDDRTSIEAALLKKLKIQKKDLLSWEIRRKSVDARNGQVLFSFVIDASLKKGVRPAKSRDITPTPDESCPFQPEGTIPLHTRPVVAGYGPAGIFAALALAQNGYKPLILERGSRIETRKKDVDTFWKEGRLNPESNVQYGEGGAGAFSDGKLTTRTKEKLARLVLQQLVEHGAKPDILIENHPHIGTDAFYHILKNIRQTIEQLGGTFRFDTRLEDIRIQDGKLQAITIEHDKQTETIPCQALILALGHSAADTLEMLYSRGLEMENKPFQVGVRIEHPQDFIDHAMLHDKWDDPALRPARYTLTAMADNGKGIYTFCMCPGGYVIASASEPGHLVVNGMSYADRGGANANSALLVQVNESDYGTQLFDGVKYQRQLEQKAYDVSKDWKAPAQNARDYLERKVSRNPVVAPTHEPGITMTDLNRIFPEPVNDALHQGLQAFDSKVPGFLDGLLTGVETRASSAIRILRSKTSLESSVAGIYPAGEGAGYAGGIMTSAIDGIKCARSLMNTYKKEV